MSRGLRCRNVLCQSFAKKPSRGNCVASIGFNPDTCEQRKMFNRIMKKAAMDIKGAIQAERDKL